MAYNVTITEVAANVAVNESSYPVTVSYNAVQLDGVGIDTVALSPAGNLIITKTDGTSTDVGLVVGADGADGADGAAGADGTNGVDGADGVSVTSATVNLAGNLIVSLSNSTTVDAGHVVGATGAAGADGADGAPGVDGTDGTDGVSVIDANVTGAGNLQLDLSNSTSIDAGPLPTGDISYTITDGSNTQTISDGDTITFNGTTNEIDVLVSATDTVTVGLVDNPTVGGNLTVTGNLTVNGTTTTLNTETLDVEDLNITVAKGAADATAANGAGLTVDGAGATLTYNSTGNVWAFDRNITVNGADVTSTKIGQWDTAYGWGDHSLAGYLTSYTETNDLTSAVTWANVPDANITQSSVTQHQAALSITESQISDLSHTTSLPFASITATPTTVAGYGITDALTAETNDLTTAVTWANIPDANVPQSAVTQHQAALSITQSQITDLDHYSDADVDTHLNTGTASASQILSYTGTDYDWIDVSASGLTNVVEDTTPQLGGSLDLNTNSITGTGDIDINGDVTANQFLGTQFTGAMNGPMVFNVIARGTNILKGQPVYISGLSGNTPEIRLAQANSGSTMPAFGIANTDITVDTAGQIVSFGQLEGTDVADWGQTGITFSLGDILYVSATQAGKLTNVAPTGEGNLIQNIGKVERISPTTNATIMVAGAGRTNATPALDTGNIFYGVGNVSSTVNLDTTVASLGFIKDYTVTEGDVTAHQAALSITESQISDLSHTTSLPFASITSTPTTLAGYGITDAATSAQGALADTALQSFTETNDLTTAVTWANVPDANITQSSVTQHQAALSITESQISDLSHTTTLPFSSITSTPTTLAGYGITDASAPAIAIASSDNTITVSNISAVSSTQAKFGSNSIPFNGTNSKLQVENSELELTGDFTIEQFVWLTDQSANQLIVTNRSTTGYNAEEFYLQWTDVDSKFQWGIQGLSAVSSTNTFAYDTWHHVALVRSGSTVQLYVNGVAEGAATTYSGDIGSVSIDSFYYGLLGTSFPFSGYLDEIRISNSARYTGAFTPTTTAFNGDLTTVFLTHAEVFPIEDDIGAILDASVTAAEIRSLLDVDQAGSGGSSNSFSTIATTSGTNPVADSSTDTLTLTAGSGITITGDASTDTVTIATTGGASGTGNIAFSGFNIDTDDGTTPMDIGSGWNGSFTTLEDDTVGGIGLNGFFSTPDYAKFNMMDDNVEILATGGGFNNSSTMLSMAAHYDVGNVNISLNDWSMATNVNTLLVTGDANVTADNGLTQFGFSNNVNAMNFGGGSWAVPFFGETSEVGTVYADVVTSNINVAWLNDKGNFGNFTGNKNIPIEFNGDAVGNVYIGYSTVGTYSSDIDLINLYLPAASGSQNTDWTAQGTQPGPRGATNYYNIYTEDNFANEHFGMIDSFTEYRHDTATSGTIAIDKANGQVQNIALTADLTISGFSNFYTGETVGSRTKSAVDTVTVVIRQDATGRTVTLPTGANYFYAGENSTVDTTASSVTMLSITAIDNAGTDQYLITVSPAFVSS